MIAADKSSFAKWLRSACRAHFPYVATRRTLAEALGMSSHGIDAWFTGRSTPPSTVVKTLAEVLRVPLSDIIAAMQIDTEFLEARAARWRSVANADQRERYATDPEYYTKVRASQACPPEKKTVARLHQEWVMSLPEDDHRAYLRYKRSEKAAKKKARLLNLGEDFTSREFWAKTKSLGYVCCYCGISRKELESRGQDLTADHVYALALVDDPTTAHLASNSIDAVFPACFHCNSSKQARDLMEWAAWKGVVATLHPAVVNHYHAWPKQRAPA